MEIIEIRDATIRLGQLLKLADIIDQGSDAQALLMRGEVMVNGEIETRRGRQLVPGDQVSAGGKIVGIATRAH